jgi:hypothetical protein
MNGVARWRAVSVSSPTTQAGVEAEHARQHGGCSTPRRKTFNPANKLGSVGTWKLTRTTAYLTCLRIRRRQFLAQRTRA